MLMSVSAGDNQIPTLPVGKDFAVIVHLDLQHLVLVQLAGDGPPECLKENTERDECRCSKG